MASTTLQSTLGGVSAPRPSTSVPTTSRFTAVPTALNANRPVDADSNMPPFKKAKKRTSLMWMFFEKMEGTEKARCMLCSNKGSNVTISCNGGCTTAMKNHVTSHHAPQYTTITGEDVGAGGNQDIGKAIRGNTMTRTRRIGGVW
ncbi:hypothetical protein CLOP_g12533 [Closterium sp. NIES-67]|nr:hypothetical protein CLOP_g18711 [Closterium sp. NIES-67]GJP82298.1 hypothetical protein CLOP_g12533 [Closterium sp. NIES-67]